MKRALLILMGILSISSMAISQVKSIYDFKVEDVTGKEFDMATLKGKKILIVNVASKCGLTPQYKELEELYQEYKEDDFIIIGFPSRDFLGQEFEKNSDIQEFCSLNYGVSFPIMSRISVKGKNQAPIYKWLTQKSENGIMNSKVGWNFQKYMISEEGKLIDFVKPKESPKSEKIMLWLKTKNLL